MENGSFFNSTTSTKGIPTERLVVGIILYIVILITIVGNILVLIAIGIEKRLQTLFNYYVVNLAITDIGVAVTAMTFYTLDITLGYWPFGQVMCGLWIFFDYGMTFASVFTLIIISVERFWSVTWSLRYRTHHTHRKCLAMIATVWVVMLVLWLPACVTDRIQNSEPEVCIWEPSLNKEFVVVVAVLGHHGSFCILVFCYIRVLVFMRRRQVQPRVGHAAASSNGTAVAGDDETVTDGKFLRPPPNAGTRGRNIQVNRDATGQHQHASGGTKERKVFVTLSYIIFGYIICWLPFHIVFDISSIAPEKVPDTLYTITFWMTYFNSTLNPFLYNFSSRDFRQAFWKILRCKCRKIDLDESENRTMTMTLSR